MRKERNKPSDIDIMCAVVRLGQRAYGLEILAELESRGFKISQTAIYRALERLEDEKVLTSEFGEPIAERGGRRRRLFRLSGECVREIVAVFPLVTGRVPR